MQKIAAQVHAFLTVGQNFEDAFNDFLERKFEEIKAIRERRKAAQSLAEKLKFIKEADEQERYWQEARLNFFKVSDYYRENF